MQQQTCFVPDKRPRRAIDGPLVRCIALMALLAAPVDAESYRPPPKGSAEQRAAYERSQARQMAFEQELFVGAGFRSLFDLHAEGRDVKRVLFEDPYQQLDFAGVEVERLIDGSLTLKVIGAAGASGATALPNSTWLRLTSLQGALFRRKTYVPWSPSTADASASLPPAVCHGWIVRFGMSDGKGVESGSWAQCGGGDARKARFATEMARLAVSTRRGCSFDARNPFWSFRTCFNPLPRS